MAQGLRVLASGVCEAIHSQTQPHDGQVRWLYVWLDQCKFSVQGNPYQETLDHCHVNAITGQALVANL
jgi:hypothetical protein